MDTLQRKAPQPPVIKREVINVLTKGNRDDRLFICSQSPLYFTLAYFPEIISYPFAPFHFDFFEDIRRLMLGELDEAAWVAFRESAKTSIAKFAAICWAICFSKKRYINFDSYVKENAEAALYDVVLALQTNQGILEDFGELYRRPMGADEVKLKRIGSFITENNIKVEAFSTQESTRGRVFGAHRPDFYVLDDIENAKTKESYPVTRKIIAHIDELKAGLGPGGSILYLGNYLTEAGVIAYILERISKNPNGAARNIPVMTKSGTITWPGKYVKTDKEAAAANRDIMEPAKRKISLQAKERSLGTKVFAVEMLNDPGKSEDYFFDRAVIERLMKSCVPPKKEIAGFKIWADFNPKHRYVAGGDVSEGIGADSNASALIDTSARPALVAGTYANADLAPNVFGHELARQGNLFGGCYLVVEINGPGYAAIAELRAIEYFNLHRREVKHRITGAITKEFGWRTTEATKYDMMAQVKSAIEDGELLILDDGLLQECYHYRKQDLRLLRPEEGMTRHFDKLTALALAWEGRKYATEPAEERAKKYTSPKKAGEYDG